MHVPITYLSFILMLLNPLAAALQNKCKYSLNHNLNQIIVDLELHDKRPEDGPYVKSLLRDGFLVAFDEFYYNAAADGALSPGPAHVPLQMSLLRQVVQDPSSNLDALARMFVYELCAPRLDLRVPAPISLNLGGCERVSKTAAEWRNYRWIRERGHDVGGSNGKQEEGAGIKEDPYGEVDDKANVPTDGEPRIKVEDEQGVTLENQQDVKIEN